MNLAALRLLLANSKYDDIELTIDIAPKSVEDGCFQCIFVNTTDDTCVLNGKPVTNELLTDFYYQNCQYLLNS